VFTLYLLDRIETKYCIPNNKLICDYFDLITGVSTGGLIALGITTRKPISEIIAIYENNLHKIFPGHSDYLIPRLYNGITSTLWQALGYKYDNDSLYKIATEIFGDKCMPEAENLICIPSYNLTQHACDISKKPYGGMTRDINRMMKDVIMMTSAAPMYLPTHKYNDQYYVDGGIYANNPTIIGIAEAKRYFVGKNKSYENYGVMSIGNINYIENSDPSTLLMPNTFWKLTNLSYLIDIIFYSNALYTDNLCKLLTHDTDNLYVRLEAKPQNDLAIDLDSTDPKKIALLKSIANEMMDGLLTESSTRYDPTIAKFFDKERTYENFINK